MIRKLLLWFLPLCLFADSIFAAPEGALTEPPPGGIMLEVRLGVLDHDVPSLWAGHAVENGLDGNLELLTRSFQPAILPAGGLRANLGASANNEGYTSKAYLGAVWEFEHDYIFLNTGLGAAVHDGRLVHRASRYLQLDQTPGRRAIYYFYYMRTFGLQPGLDQNRKELGSRTLFRVPFEFGLILNDHLRLSFMFDHVSNGYLAVPNQGLDTVGFRIGIAY